jgi:NAD+ synthase (glutamine-hydrolysing)
LGDLYKSEVFQIAKFINKKYKNIIPKGIIERPPSAELKKDQTDADALLPYEILDCILNGILSYGLSLDNLVQLGFVREDVERVYTLYQGSEFKRYQFCPIIKLRAKSFGFGHRVPICKKVIKHIY